MKKYLTISIILGTIALICAAILAALNLVTSPIIAKNSEATKKDTITTIYSDCVAFDEYTSDELKEKYPNATIDSKIESLIIAYSDDAKTSTLGYIYTAKGSNAYGNIEIMAAVNDELGVVQVEFLENSQSYASTVASWLKVTYNTVGATVYEVGFVSADGEDVGTVSKEDAKTVDVSCGATFGATLVRDLVTAAINTHESVKEAM
ncbi:MAG: hypothetical protein K6A63_05950 [Acholeplasmatales bacterium]|nr:hypothetical protein [Acholeplasmatales bacterium]